MKSLCENVIQQYGNGTSVSMPSLANAIRDVCVAMEDVLPEELDE